MPPPATPSLPTLLKIQEVAADTGLTTRAIRYYEEIGLLEPAARSEGAYRLYDASDLERLRFIRSLRDDAGFSLAQIGQLLEDEQARERNRLRLHSTTDQVERRALLLDAIERVDRQIEILEHKRTRLDQMIDDARARRVHLDDHLTALDAGLDAGLDAADDVALDADGAAPDVARNAYDTGRDAALDAGLDAGRGHHPDATGRR
jgi:MerR family transcriptional regulator, repressor of the yfmOP operon